MKTIQTTAFIDWDCARRIVRADPRHVRRPQILTRALQALQRSLARILADRDSRSIFRVHLRLYHGWYRGKTKTQDRRDLERLIAEPGALLPSVNRVTFALDLSYNDRLLSDPQRDLFDTLRKREEDGIDEQKMVDTALISDLLHFARSNKQQALAIVVGDDDDLLPGIFTADAWGGRVILARVVRQNDNPHLDINKFVCRLERA